MRYDRSAASSPAYVDIWWQAVNDFLDLLEEVPEEEWSTPTDLAGWDVKAVRLAHRPPRGHPGRRPEETAEVGEPPHVTGLMGLYTEIGVVNRRDASPDAIINEIREADDRAAHRAARRPADRRRREARADLRRRRRGTGGRCCATGRSTCGCTSRTYAARSAGPAAWTPRRPGTPRSTSPRASATCSPRRSAHRPAPAWCWTWRAASRSRSRSTTNGRGERARRARRARR